MRNAIIVKASFHYVRWKAPPIRFHSATGEVGRVSAKLPLVTEQRNTGACLLCSALGHVYVCVARNGRSIFPLLHTYTSPHIHIQTAFVLAHRVMCRLFALFASKKLHILPFSRSNIQFSHGGWHTACVRVALLFVIHSFMCSTNAELPMKYQRCFSSPRHIEKSLG